MALFGPKTPEDFVKKAKKAMASGNPERAVRLLDEGLAKHTRSEALWTARLGLHAALDDVDTALKCSDVVLELSNGSADAWFMRGRLLQDDARNQEAAEAYQAAVAAEPRHLDSWVNLGCVLDNDRRHEHAIEAYSRALDIEPEDPDAWFNRGNSLLALGRFNEAVPCYEKARAHGQPDAVRKLRAALAYGGRSNEAAALEEQTPQQGELRERCRKLGEATLVARYFIGLHSNPELLDSVVESLLDFAASRASTPPGISDGVTLQVFWPIVTVRQRGASLVLCEPESTSDPSRLRDEVTFTAQLLVMFRLIHDVVGADPTPCPYNGTLRLQPSALQVERVVMTRHPPESDDDSGWQLTSQDSEDSEDPFVTVPTLMLASSRVHLTKVLALPVGWSAHFDGSQLEQVFDHDGRTRIN